jgi:hypothetical protein
MDLNIRKEYTSAEENNWLASKRGVNEMVNVTLRNADFNVALYNVPGTNGTVKVVPSGTPLSKSADGTTYVPYVDADPEAVPAVEGSGAVEVLLFADVKLSSGVYSHGAGLDQGKAIESELPVAISDAAKASNTGIKYL